MSNPRPASRLPLAAERHRAISGLPARSSRGRAEAEEWLDRPGLSPQEIAANLRDFERVNRWLGGARSVLAHMAPVFDAAAGRPLRALDIACGAGDLLRALAHRARRRGVKLAGVGVDANRVVIACARAAAPGFAELTWVQADALNLPFAPGSFDLVTCAGFLHHLAPERVVAFLRQARLLSRGWLIAADVMRSTFAYQSFRLLAVLAGLHRVTRHDGAVSLRRGYTPAELAQLATAAGLSHWSVHRHPFCRMSLISGPREV